MKKYILATCFASLAFAGAAFAQNYTFNNDLRLGSSGQDVVNLQTWLIGNGFNIPAIANGGAKGYYGTQTLGALIAYQQSVGLPAYGYFGPMTRAKLNGNQSINSFKVTSPNGGEVWTTGTTQYITWSGASQALNQTGDIKLEYALPACARPGQIVRCMIMVRAPQLIQRVNLSAGSYAWNVGTVANPNCSGDPLPMECATSSTTITPNGQYRIQICPTNGNCVESDNDFTITSSQNSGQTPVINGLDAPTTLAVNQTGTWTVHATDPLNSQLSYMVLWGDEPISPMTNSVAMTPAVAQTSTFTHTYANPGTYTVQFTVKNAANLSAQTSATVTVSGTASAGPLRITSPNGGEVWQKGTMHNITWTSPYYIRATYADLRLQAVMPSCPAGQMCSMMMPAPYTIASGISINQNSYNWNVGSYNGIVTYPNNTTSVYPVSQVVPDGQYTMLVCEVSSSNCDSSDTSFTISSGSNQNNASVSVVAPNGGEIWAANSTQGIRWNVYNNTDPNARLDLYLGQNLYLPCAYNPSNPPVSCNQFQTQYTLDRNIAVNSVYNWIVATDINNRAIQPGNYAVRICLSGTNNCGTSANSFTITSSPVYMNQSYPSCPAGYSCVPNSTSQATH